MVEKIATNTELVKALGAPLFIAFLLILLIVVPVVYYLLQTYPKKWKDLETKMDSVLAPLTSYAENIKYHREESSKAFDKLEECFQYLEAKVEKYIDQAQALRNENLAQTLTNTNKIDNLTQDMKEMKNVLSKMKDEFDKLDILKQLLNSSKIVAEKVRD